MIRNSFILKTISVFLTFWMLFASAGLSVDFHYCDGEIVDWNISGNELICNHAKQEAEPSSCCKSSHDFLETSHKFTQIEDDCCDTGEAEMVVSQEFDLSKSEIEFLIPVVFYFSLNLPSVKSESVKQIGEQKVNFPSIPILRKLACIQTFII